VKLFLKISNLCDHDTSTSRTDRRLCLSSTALCVTLRGYKLTPHFFRRTTPNSNCGFLVILWKFLIMWDIYSTKTNFFA